jgi:hypothetical protein
MCALTLVLACIHNSNLELHGELSMLLNCGRIDHCIIGIQFSVYITYHSRYVSCVPENYLDYSHGVVVR